jgi:hypothetical protein
MMTFIEAVEEFVKKRHAGYSKLTIKPEVCTNLLSSLKTLQAQIEADPHSRTNPETSIEVCIGLHRANRAPTRDEAAALQVLQFLYSRWPEFSGIYAIPFTSYPGVGEAWVGTVGHKKRRLLKFLIEELEKYS